VALLGALLALVASGSSSASPAGGVTLSKANDANHDGVFSTTEAVPGNVSYPWTVTYQLTVFGGTAPGPNGPFHHIDSIGDNRTSDIGSCQALVGTDINNGETKTCTYDVTLTGPGSGPLVNTARLGYDGLGNDTDKSSSTVTFTGGSGCPATPPKVNVRWHYSANGTSGSWSGTKTAPCGATSTLGPQAMEGNLKVDPGTLIKAGYSFTLPGNHNPWTVSFTAGQVVFGVHCVSGATPSQPTFTITLPNQSYSVIDSAWYPSGSQSSPLVYQGSAPAPDLCGGGMLRLDQGGTFSAFLSIS
jgi:hypothetical protein